MERFHVAQKRDNNFIVGTFPRLDDKVSAISQDLWWILFQPEGCEEREDGIVVAKVKREL